jgi:hypothetical protein
VRLERLNGGAPLLNTHSRWASRTCSAWSRRLGGRRQAGRATVRFSEREDVEPIFRDVKDKIIVNVSSATRSTAWSSCPRRDSDGCTIYRAVDWEPMELSLVPIGADAGAGVRSTEKDRTYPCEVIDNIPAAPPLQERKP